PGSDHLVGAACLLSLLALPLGYLQLTCRAWRPPAKAAWTAGLATLCLLLALLLAPAAWQPHDLASWLPELLAVPVALAAAFLALWKPERWKRLTRPRRVAAAWAHPALGLLLLLLLSVLPAIAIWKAAVALSMDSFVKRGQLVLADELIAR